MSLEPMEEVGMEARSEDRRAPHHGACSIPKVDRTTGGHAERQQPTKHEHDLTWHTKMNSQGSKT